MRKLVTDGDTETLERKFTVEGKPVSLADDAVRERSCGSTRLRETLFSFFSWL